MTKIFSILAAVAVIAPVAVFADVNATNGTITSPVVPNAAVPSSLTVVLSSGDSWRSTRVDVSIPGPNNDIDECKNTQDFTDTVQGNFTASTTFSFIAPSATGTYTAYFTAFENSNCTGEYDWVSKQLVVEIPVVEPEPEPSGGSEEPSDAPAVTSGGGGPCHPSTGYPECQQNVAYFQWRAHVDLYEQLISKLQILIWKLEEAQN